MESDPNKVATATAKPAQSEALIYTFSNYVRVMVLIIPALFTNFNVLLVELNHMSPLRGAVGSVVTIGTVNLCAVSNLRKREKMSSKNALKSNG